MDEIPDNEPRPFPTPEYLAYASAVTGVEQAAIGTAIHRTIEAYADTIRIRKEHGDTNLRIMVNPHTHIDFRREWTLRSQGVSRKLFDIMTGYNPHFLDNLRRTLKVHKRQTSRTSAGNRTNSKRKRAGMRRTRRMMA